MATRTVYQFFVSLVFISGFFTNTLRAQTPRVDSCSASGSGNPVNVRTRAKVVDANTGTPISGASVTITVSGKSTTVTTDAAGNCSGNIAFPLLSDLNGTTVTVCVTGTNTCCECKVGAGVAKKGKGPGEVALVVFAVLALSWLGWKYYSKQRNVA
jgi:hypothetical protein